MPAMLDALCVIGHPSRLGGADTELDHQIHCWQALGIAVHICPTGPLDQNLLSMKLAERGCIYHAPRDWRSLEGLHCISFCNGEFLAALPDIRKYARTTTFVNCMTWNFEQEIEMQERGLIDFHLYQTDHALQRVSERLRGRGNFRPMTFRPYFHKEGFPFIEERPTDKFRFGRISRDDGDIGRSPFAGRPPRHTGDRSCKSVGGGKGDYRRADEWMVVFPGGSGLAPLPEKRAA
jgi:hypothetical protein